MHLRRCLFAVTACAVVVAGTVAIATPAIAGTTSPASAKATVSATVPLEDGAIGAVYYIKPQSSLHDAVAQANASSGTVTESTLAAGTYVLQVQDYGTSDAPLDYLSKSFTVTSGQHLDLGTLHVTKQPLTLSGRGPKGGVVNDYHTGWNALMSQATVSDSGHYALKGLLPGTYKITAQKTGYEDKTYTVVVREPVKDVSVGRKK